MDMAERADDGDSKKPYGDVTYADPGYQKDKVKRYPLDSADHCRAAWSYINMPKNAAMYSPENLASIKSRIKAAAKKFGVEIGEEQQQESRFGENEIETREADVTSVNYSQRIVTLIAAPYEQPAMISLRGEPWQEVFERGAWDTLKNMRPTRYRANRGHDKNRTVGKVVNLWPNRDEGLVAEIKLSNTPLGNETLELAADDCLSASVGFGVPPSGDIKDRNTRTRRVTTAYLDHIAFVENPAYEGASVLGVRSQGNGSDLERQLRVMAEFMELLRGQEQMQQRQATPELDQFIGDDVFRWASERLSGK